MEKVKRRPIEVQKSWSSTMIPHSLLSSQSHLRKNEKENNGL